MKEVLSFYKKLALAEDVLYNKRVMHASYRFFMKWRKTFLPEVLISDYEHKTYAHVLLLSRLFLFRERN